MPRSMVCPPRFVKRTALVLLLAASCATIAHARFAPPPGPPTPSAEMLATIPSLTTAQQIELRKILIERRDAHDAASTRSHDAFEVQRKKDRAEHERIDDQSSERVRKLLGDDGFRRYAQWQLSHRGPGPDHADDPGRGDARGARDGRPGGRPGPDGRPPLPGGAAPQAPAGGGDTP